jgi:hypothetical protein
LHVQEQTVLDGSSQDPFLVVVHKTCKSEVMERLWQASRGQEGVRHEFPLGILTKRKVEE